MSIRWKVYTLHHQIARDEAKEIPPCPHCFALLAMLGSEEE
jgi:hypothetical protein